VGRGQGREQRREARRELRGSRARHEEPVLQDFDDSLQPANLVTLAASPSGRILYVVSTESDHRIRIISARDATRHERRLYEEAE
jgi:uncharacterized DUF497 family protein